MMVYKQRFVEDDLTAQEDLKKIKREKRFDFDITRLKEFSKCVKEQDLGYSIDNGNMIIGIVYKEVEE